jgi:ribulose-bisphosphate carboxylase large chain
LRYIDFVDLEYKPQETDLVCTFHVEPQGISLKEAAGGVAAESSIGTWTELTTEKEYIKKLAAKTFQIKKNIVKIAYPKELFEKGNMPNILSGISGNVFGLRTIKNLRLNDIDFPSEIIQSFKGPKYGVKGIRDILKVYDRPLVGTIIKPKLGLETSDHATIAYNAWIGGCDIVKDDENLSSQRFNIFEDRVIETLEKRDKAEKETGERKFYLVNITSETDTMMKRAEFVLDHGGEYIMVDVLTCGFSALQTLREKDYNLIIHAHRAGHAAFTKNPKHGISMQVISKIVRIIGVDQLHIGTVVGKMYETKEEVSKNYDAITKHMNGIKPVFAVASGGLHPGLVPELIRFFGKDVIIQAGGGIHGHEEGTTRGAKAMRQAVNATMKGISLREYAKTHRELKRALQKWSETSTNR